MNTRRLLLEHGGFLYDSDAYDWLHSLQQRQVLVEGGNDALFRLFRDIVRNKLKQFRRVTTRYDKLLTNFMGFVEIATMLR